MSRRLPRTWVPNQHGAWAMLIAPPVVGAVVAGPIWQHALLLVTWLSAYCAYFCAGQWLRSGRRRRYRDPALGHGSIAALLGAVLLASEPALLRWAPAYAVLATVSLACSARRADRSYLNDFVTVAAACLMTVVAAGLGEAPGPGPWPAGSQDGAAWAGAAVLATYFVGTVLYVKTMIRERGSRPTYVASVVFHTLAVASAVLALVVGVANAGACWAAVVTALALLARAVLLPRRGRMRPGVVGAGEVVATVVVTGLTLALVG